MTAATLVKSIDGRCPYVPNGRSQCKRPGNTVVAGVEQLLCKQHARIVATEPGGSGVVRRPPVGVDAIVADLDAARTFADLKRCRQAITAQITVCASQRTGLDPRLRDALQRAKSRVRDGDCP